MHKRGVVVADTDGERLWNVRRVARVYTALEAFEEAEKVAAGVKLADYAATIARVASIDAVGAAALMVDPCESVDGRLAYLVRVPAERPRIGWRELVLLDTDRTTQHGLGEELDEAGRVVFRSFYELGPASRYFAATREEYELLVTLCDQNDSELGVESEDVDWSGFVGFVGFDADEDSL